MDPETATREERQGDEGSDSDLTVMGSPASSNESPCLMERTVQTVTPPRLSNPTITQADDSDEGTLILSQPSPTPTWFQGSPGPRDGEDKTPSNHKDTRQSKSHFRQSPLPGEQGLDNPVIYQHSQLPRVSAECNTNVVYKVNPISSTTSTSVAKWTSSVSLKRFRPATVEDEGWNFPMELSPASQLCVLSQIGDLGASSTPWKAPSRPNPPLPTCIPSDQLQQQESRRSQNAYGKRLLAQAAGWDTCSEEAFDGDTSDGEKWAFDELSDSDFD